MFILHSIDAPTSAVLIALATLATGSTAVWAVLLCHTAKTVIRLPTGAAGLASPAGDEQVCVIVPAHNEAGCIGRLVDSLRAQDHPGARFVLALDRCTDDTAEIARTHIDGDDRFEIVEVTSCPDGWAGKVNAARTGVTESEFAADADLLVFTDADCVFHPGCLRSCSALLHERELDLLSLLSTLETRGWFDWVCQPAATLELIRQYPLLRANRPDATRRPFANGQFMMFRSKAYKSVGGHEAVHDALLEDIAFARLLSHPDHGFRTGLLLAGGMVRCRMYDTWPQFRAGWKRIYTESLNKKSRRMQTASMKIRLVGTVMPLGAMMGVVGSALLLPEAGALGEVVLILSALGVLAWLLGIAVVVRAGRAPLLSAPMQIVGAWLVGGILAEASRDLASGRPMRWGGREYVLEDRS